MNPSVVIVTGDVDVKPAIAKIVNPNGKLTTIAKAK